MKNVNWSKAIKTLREEMFVTQTELAKLLDVSYVSINRWENSHFEPTMKAKRKIAELLKKYNISLED